MSDVPKPGSYEALDEGCLCPILDNRHGEGQPYTRSDGSEGRTFVFRVGCPLHGEGHWLDLVGQRD